MNKNINPICKTENIVIQEFEAEVLIYDLTKNKAFCLNNTSATIWKLCDGSNSIKQISELATDKFSSPINEDFVWLALTNLKKARLINFEENKFSEFGHLSRREVVKKIGLTSMVALPVVISIVSPTPINAQSCVRPNTPVGDAVPNPPGDCSIYNSLCCNMTAAPAFGVRGFVFCQCVP